MEQERKLSLKISSTPVKRLGFKSKKISQSNKTPATPTPLRELTQLPITTTPATVPRIGLQTPINIFKSVQISRPFDSLTPDEQAEMRKRPSLNKSLREKFTKKRINFERSINTPKDTKDCNSDNEIERLREEIRLKEEEIARHNRYIAQRASIQESTRLWTKKCQEAITDLAEKVNNSVGDVINALNIPYSLIHFDPLNNCFQDT